MSGPSSPQTDSPPRASDPDLPHIVIVGGGFGGLHAAKALGHAPARVTLIDRSNHHLFQPLLYQVATAALSPEDIAAPLRNVLAAQSNTGVLMAAVTGIDTAGRRVLLGDQSVAYDYLVIATGSHYNYFGHNEWEPFAPNLKSIGDAVAVRRDILQAFETAELESDPEEVKALLTFVLVGAGPTGVEMSGAIAELAHKALAGEFRHIDPRSSRILLLEAGPRILSTFPDSLAKSAEAELTSMGVEVRVNAAVESVDSDGVCVGGEQIRSHTVIWAAGVVASPAGKWLSADTDRLGRVKVKQDLSVPGHPEIFVIGDTAYFEDRGKPLPGLAPVAIQQGEYVAALLRRRLRSAREPRPFRYFNKGNLATVGRSYAVFDWGAIHLTGFIAWVLWLVVHIYFLIGFRNRIVVIFQWCWAYFTAQRGARLIDPDSGANE